MLDAMPFLHTWLTGRRISLEKKRAVLFESVARLHNTSIKNGRKQQVNIKDVWSANQQLVTIPSMAIPLN